MMLPLVEAIFAATNGSVGSSVVLGPDGGCNTFNTTQEYRECEVATVVAWVSLLVAVAGIYGNLHIVYVYGWVHGFSRSSNGLSFAYGTLNTINCLCAAIAAGNTLNHTSEISCFTMLFLYILMTRTSLYVFLFFAYNRYYACCLMDKDRNFFTMKRTRLFLILCSLLTAAELVIQLQSGCEPSEAGSLRQLFIKPTSLELYNHPQEFEVVAIATLNFINWFFLLFTTVLSTLLYWRVVETFKARKRRLGGLSDEDRYEQRVAKQFRWSTFLALLGLYPQTIIQIVTFFAFDNVQSATFLDPELFVTLAFIAELLNLVVFATTPLVFMYFNYYFRLEVKKVYCKDAPCTRWVYPLTHHGHHMTSLTGYDVIYDNLTSVMPEEEQRSLAALKLSTSHDMDESGGQ